MEVVGHWLGGDIELGGHLQVLIIAASLDVAASQVQNPLESDRITSDSYSEVFASWSA